MIDMRMGQQDEIYGLGIEDERLIIQSRDILGALVHPAVYEESRSADLEQIAGAGDDLRSSAEGEFHKGKGKDKHCRYSTQSMKKCKSKRKQEYVALEAGFDRISVLCYFYIITHFQ